MGQDGVILCPFDLESLAGLRLGIGLDWEEVPRCHERYVTDYPRKKERVYRLVLDHSPRQGTDCLMGWMCMMAGWKSPAVADAEMRVQKKGQRAGF